MNVGELKEALADLAPDLPVILSKDPEGNRFLSLTDVDLSKCSSDGYDGLEPVHPDDEDDYDEDDLVDGVVLWP